MGPAYYTQHDTFKASLMLGKQKDLRRQDIQNTGDSVPPHNIDNIDHLRPTTELELPSY